MAWKVLMREELIELITRARDKATEPLDIGLLPMVVVDDRTGQLLRVLCCTAVSGEQFGLPSFVSLKLIEGDTITQAEYMLVFNSERETKIYG